MTKKLLQQLVLASYKNNQLNAHIVDEIVSNLSRQDLKAYIRALKLMEQQKKIHIALPKANLYNTTKQQFKALFPKKEMVFEEDPSLLLGVKLVDDDMVYEMNLRDRLDWVIQEIDRQYSQ